MAEDPVAFFNLDSLQCHLKDGRAVPITRLFDRLGEEIAGDFKPEDLYSFVAGEGAFWVVVYVDSFEPVTFH